jgi:hypothetical protein
MASIRKEIRLDAAPEDVWAALRDWGALHERLVPLIAVDTHLDGDERIYSHHNASAQVFAKSDGRARFVWIADVLPHDAARQTDELMEQGTGVLKRTLEARAVRDRRAV